MNNSKDIVSDVSISKKVKLAYKSKIDKALVWALDKPFDILLSTNKDIEKYKDSKHLLCLKKCYLSMNKKEQELRTI